MIVEVIRGLSLGGAETLLYQRIRELARMRELSRDYMVLNTQPELEFYRPSLEALGVRVEQAASPDPVDGFRAVARVTRGLGADDVAIFHSPATTYWEKCKRLIGGEGRYRMVEVVHSTRYRRLYWALGHLLDRAADLAVWVSEDVRKSPVGATFRRGEVVLGGVDRAAMRTWVKEHAHAPVEMIRHLDIDRRRGLIVSVGNLKPEKAHDRLIQAMAHASLEEYSCVIVGDGPEREKLERLISQLKLEERVRLVGRVEDGWRWTAIADVVCQPSIIEGLPVSLMEARALGTPIVATNVGGVAQLVPDASVGQLLGDSAPELIATALRARLSATPPIAEVWPRRGSEPTPWDIENYVDRFYSIILRSSLR